MSKEHPLEVYASGHAILTHQYLCSLCGWEGNHMGIVGMHRERPSDYECGCPDCLTRWSTHRLIIMDEHDTKSLGEEFRSARSYRRTNKFVLLPEWDTRILALEKVLLRPSEQRGYKKEDELDVNAAH